MNNDNWARRSALTGSFRSLAITALCFAAVLSGCASSGPRQTADGAATEGGVPESLQQRAQERWQLLVAGEPDKAYEFLSPGYRSTVTKQDYGRKAHQSRIKWTAARWRDGHCAQDDACSVRMEVQYAVSMPSAGDVPSQTLLTESWLKVDGQWYFLPEG